MVKHVLWSFAKLKRSNSAAELVVLVSHRSLCCKLCMLVDASCINVEATIHGSLRVKQLPYEAADTIARMQWQVCALA